MSPSPRHSALLRRKSIEAQPGSLEASVGRFQLLFLGIGAIVGSGIFVILGFAIPLAGPGVMASFAIAALAAMVSAFSYAELASSVPMSGSSYSYAYVTLGEIVAWVVGWMLLLEYAVSLAAVAVGWGEYLNSFLSEFGMEIPAQIAQPPGEGGIINIPAIFVILSVAVLLLRGASESARVNAVMVVLKSLILVFFAAVALTTFDGSNFEPFLPLGVAGVSAAAGQVFFSYIGFDAVATAAEEAKNPRRDLPFAIIGSLIAVTVLYLLVAAATIGAIGWDFTPDDNIEALLSNTASDIAGSWAGSVISVGAVISIFSVLLVTLYASTRILFAISRDGLMPPIFARLSARTHVPVAGTLIVAVSMALVAGFVPLGHLAEMVSIGTLGTFAIMNVGVIVLRRRGESVGFRTPLFPVLPLIGIGLIMFLAVGLRAITWIAFVTWMTIGLLVYFGYSRSRSVMAKEA